MTTFIGNPYRTVDDYVPRSTVRRSFTPDAVMSSAADAATGLLAAREARRSGLEDGDEVHYSLNAENAESAPRTSTELRLDPARYGHTPDNAMMQTPERVGTTYAHPDNPMMQTPEAQRSAVSLADTIGRISGPTSSDPRGVTPEDIRSTPVPIASQARDDYARPRPLPAPIFRPQPEVGGRPNDVPDHVALDAVRRAVAANDESAFDDVARLAWQREASINGNPSGDTSAPKAYIESWKGQMRAGEDAGPYGNMLLQAAQQSRAASSIADQQRIAAERAALATTPSAVATAQSRLAPLTQSPGRPTAGEPGGPPLANGPVLASPPSPRSQMETLPDRGNAPAVMDTLPDRGQPAERQNLSAPAERQNLSAPAERKDYSLIDDVLAPYRGAQPRSTATPAPQGNDLEQWTRSEAKRLGIDPDIAVRVANSEGGFDDPVRQNSQGQPAYGPFQLHITGNAAPGKGYMGDEALAAGIDPRKPQDAKRGITFALERAAERGWRPWYGAARVGIGDRDGIGQAPPRGEAKPEALPMTGKAASETTQFGLVDDVLKSPSTTNFSMVDQILSSPKTTVATQTKAVQQGKSVWEAGKLTPNQYHEGRAQGLDDETALAVCGPAAAIAFARKQGRNPTFDEAIKMAKQVGWTVSEGMAGPQSQVRLLNNMGIPSEMEDGPPNPAKVAKMVQGGSPVILSTPGHYFVAERFDPATGKFDFGESAKVLKINQGQSWFTIDEIRNMGMGTPRATIFMQGV